MPDIHPTAIIDPQATVEAGAKIGPYCVIDGPVTIAADTELISYVHLKGPMAVGRGNRFFPQVSVGLEPQDMKFDGRTAGVVIGDDNVFREGVTVHASNGEDETTTIGSGNYLMTNCHIAHNCVLHDRVTLASGVLLAGHIEIFDQVFIGGNAAIQQFCRIGRLAMQTGLVGMSHDLPPFCLSAYTKQVNALNLIGLRRAGLRDHIPALKKAFDILYRQGHANSEAVTVMERELADDPLCMELAEFVRTAKRGIMAYKGTGGTRQSKG